MIMRSNSPCQKKWVWEIGDGGRGQIYYKRGPKNRWDISR